MDIRIEHTDGAVNVGEPCRTMQRENYFKKLCSNSVVKDSFKNLSKTKIFKLCI